MAEFHWKQSLKRQTSILQSYLLEPVTIMIVNNDMIGWFGWEELEWLACVTVLTNNFRCPITAYYPITLSNYNFADKLVQNTAVHAPITLEEIVIVMFSLEISRQQVQGS